MPDFITLSCPTCSGKLEITKDIERFSCGYCGQEHLIKRGGGIISLSPIIDDIKAIRYSSEKTSAELAIKRLGEDIEDIKLEQLRIVSGFIDEHINDFEVVMFLAFLLGNFDGVALNLPLNVETKDLLSKRILSHSKRIQLHTEEDWEGHIEKITKEKQFRILKTRESCLRVVELLLKLNSRILELDRDIQKSQDEISRLRILLSE